MTEQTIFTEAMEIADPALREEYLARVCAGNIPLRQKIEALLASHEQSGEFLDVPALRQMAKDDNTETMNNGEPKIDSDEIDLSFLVPSARPGSLGRLQHYEIEAVLGSGGCGIVLKAFDEKLHRVVAIKVMLPGLALTSPARKRFIREARASAAIRHDNVVNIHAIEDGPIPFLVMEFIDGQTLQQRINGMGPLETEEILRLGRQIAQGLSAAHALGLIHRDIKPANIMIEASGRVKITDFGLARAADDASVTQSGAIAGTPLYMSPEQTQGQPLDARSDLFSLGSVLYVMACGRPPFRAGNTMAVMKRVAEETPRPIREIIPEVPQWLVDVIAKLHAKEPEKRYASAAEVSKALATGEQDPNQAESVNRRDTKRRRWILPGLALSILAGLIGVVYLVNRGKRHTVPETPAEQAKLTEPGWAPLFDGQTLSGWKTASGFPNYWKIENGELVGKSEGVPGSCLFTTKTDYTNYRLRTVCKSLDQGQILSRCKSVPDKQYPCGYYVSATSIQNAYGATGTIGCEEFDNNSIWHSLALPYPCGVKAGEWFTLEMEVYGSRISVFVNGEKICAFEDAQQRFQKGCIGLQVHDDASEIRIKSIEVCELPSGEPTEPDPLLEKHRKAIEWVYKLGGTITLQDGMKQVDADLKQALGMKLPMYLLNFNRVLGLTAENLQCLRDLPFGVSYVVFDGSDIKDEEVAAFITLPWAKGITEFRANHTKITDEAFRSLANLPRLNILHVGDCRQINGKGFKYLKDSSIGNLALPQTPVADEAVDDIVDIKNLWGLWIRHTPITEKGIAKLAAAKREGKLSKLYMVHFGCGNQITDAAIEDLITLYGGKWVAMQTTSVTNAGLKMIATKHSDLKKLNLGECKINDTGLAVLDQFPNLEWLTLQWGHENFTDAGLEHVAKCKSLKDVDLRATKVTEAGVRKLAAALPKCHIDWDGGAINPTKQ